MSAAQVGEARTEARLSEVAAGLLALVIERPSYGYELWQRFEDRFGSLQSLVAPRVYKLLDQLERRGYVEEFAADEQGQSPRQPKPHYRATAKGARYYREWLAASIKDDPRREELLRRLLATTARDAKTMLQIVESYERACLDGMTRRAALDKADRPTRPSRLRDRLIDEERRLAHESQLKFVAYARRAINDEIARQEAAHD